MTRGAAFLLALGIAGAAFLYGGIWAYGDGFIFNRFNGEIIYVTLPDDEEAVRLPARLRGPPRGGACPAAAPAAQRAGSGACTGVPVGGSGSVARGRATTRAARGRA